MKRWAKITIALIVIALGAAMLWWQMTTDTTKLRIGGAEYAVSIMRSQAQLEHGLSDTDSLPAGTGMLFVFPEDKPWPMWMKDMKYAIDMVWLNDYGQVVHTVKDAQPASYPSTVFRPEEPARYVIELPSGTIEKTGIKYGDTAGLPSGV